MEPSQYHPSESVILDDNRDDGDADDIQHLSISAAVQFDSAMKLAVASTRYFHEGRAFLETEVIA